MLAMHIGTEGPSGGAEVVPVGLRIHRAPRTPIIIIINARQIETCPVTHSAKLIPQWPHLTIKNLSEREREREENAIPCMSFFLFGNHNNQPYMRRDS